MVICTRCNNSLTLFNRLSSFVNHSTVCSQCEGQIKNIIDQLKSQLEQASKQKNVTNQFYNYVHYELNRLHIPSDQSSELLIQLDYQKHITDEWQKYQKYLSDIRQGYLPVIRVNAIIDTDEKAHLETPATYYKPNKQIKYVAGRLIATNKQLYFITPDKDSMKIDWNNIVSVNQHSGISPNGLSTSLVHIQVSKGAGGGQYYLDNSEVAVAIITTAVRLWKRHLVELKANPNTQGIPEHVKAAVFQRDGGRCRQCGYTGPYIEYDHIYPRSKGGQNTVENIQLLCRQCNMKKGNR